jgi:hypothetical protein
METAEPLREYTLNGNKGVFCRNAGVLPAIIRDNKRMFRNFRHAERLHKTTVIIQPIVFLRVSRLQNNCIYSVIYPQLGLKALYQ